MSDLLRQFVRIFRGAPVTQTPPLSAPNSARVYHDIPTQTLMLSENGGPYLPIASGAVGGAVDIIQIQSFS